MIENHLQRTAEHLVFNGVYAEAYIPEYYFEGKFAEDHGSSVQAFGLFTMRTFDAKGKVLLTETFNIPSMIILYPSEMEKKELQLIEGEYGHKEMYRVAKFYKGGKVMNNSITQDATNAELFINMLIRGNIPTTIPYNQIAAIWKKNMALNNVNLGVTDVVLELIIAEIYRNRKKPEERFAKQIGKNPSMSQYAYLAATIREICARNSTFAGLTFEDIDSMITTSLNISKYDKQESESPIEKIIKM